MRKISGRESGKLKMSEYICPNCKNPIYDDDALLCLYCGENLRRGVGFMGKIKYPTPRAIIFGIIIVVLTGFVIFILNAYAEDEDGTETRPGTTLIKESGLNILVPDGAKVRKGPGGSVYIESSGEYVGRRLIDIEVRLKSIEDTQDEIKKEIHKLKERFKKETGGLVSNEQSSIVKTEERSPAE